MSKSLHIMETAIQRSSYLTLKGQKGFQCRPTAMFS